MLLHINGEQVEVEDGVNTVTDLLTHFKLQNKVVIVELNQNILEKEQHPDSPVQEGDRIEIVHFVGGG